MSMNNRTIARLMISFVAIIFGALTIMSAYKVIFIDGAARIAAGNTVDFVLWFNFLAGFIYIITGVGILLKQSWSITASALIAMSTSFIFILLGLHIVNDGLFEYRTVYAMILRTTVWSTIAVLLRYRYNPLS